MVLFSLRVQEVLSSILGMPHITNIDERCLIFVGQNVIGYSKAAKFNFPITSLNLHRRDVFQFGFWKRDSFTNLNVIIAITREFCLPVQFSICVNSQNAQLYKFPRELLELCMSTRECFTDCLTSIRSTSGVWVLLSSVSIWCSGVIISLGATGPECNSQNDPFH